MDRFNRQLHPEEKRAIKNLANGDADKAGCALVHCAAEYAPGTVDYAKYAALEAEGAGYTTQRAQLQDHNGTSVSLAGYGGMVRQSSGRWFQYPVADSTADNKAMQPAMEAQRAGSVDDLTVQGGGLGGGGALTVNLHNGNVYLSGPGSMPVVPSASIVGGMVASNPGLPTGQKGSNTDDFLAGASAGGGVCAVGVCGGVNHGIGGDTAFEVGVETGGITKALNPNGYGGTNPTDASRKFNLMKSDMDYMLGMGGKVAFRKKLDRGSVASLTRNLSADSSTHQLFARYQMALEGRGWKVRQRADNKKWEARKLGALVTLDIKPEFFPALSINTYGVRFEYSAGTIGECGP
ncbi:hypothetical protein [Paraburkholderia phenoliruptrix]|uniref:hypothetical protein n=1 Tax=Paraburkholderia phenoliruptrix TaxID=252970 RepID=UPI002869825A|nr:hypothetical protein [Paraburkholderia phenoliruptrix]WMY09817.1 hypothetical protein P3F88_08700 [Paraburkholderia phenoliruptrix]